MPYPEQEKFHFPAAEVFSATMIIMSGIKIIRPSRILVLLSLFGLFLFPPVAAPAQFKSGPEMDVYHTVSKEGDAPDWAPQERKGTTELQSVHDNGTQVLYLRSASSALNLLLDVVLAIREFSFLDWAWKDWMLPLYSGSRETPAHKRALIVQNI